MSDEAPYLLPVEGNFTDIGDAKREAPKWVIPNLLPCGLTFVAGPAKIARKSTVVMAMSALVSGIGEDALPSRLRKVERKGTVLGLSAEATVGELRDMLETGFGYEIPRDGSILIADAPWDFKLDSENGLQQCLQWMKDRKPRVFFIDPLAHFHSLEENDSGAMTQLLWPIQRLAKEQDSAAIVVHHTRKKGKDEGDYTALDMRGSSALMAIADGAIVVSPRKDPVVHYSCLFKRGVPWESDIVLGGWGEEAREINPEHDALKPLVVSLLLKGVFKDVTTMSRFMKKPAALVSEVLNELADEGTIERTKRFYEAHASDE